MKPVNETMIDKRQENRKKNLCVPLRLCASALKKNALGTDRLKILTQRRKDAEIRREEKKGKQMTERKYVQQIPDLIQPSEYERDPQGKRMKFRIRVSGKGIEIVGDAQRPEELEKILKELSPDAIEQMLCG